MKYHARFVKPVFLILISSVLMASDAMAQMSSNRSSGSSSSSRSSSSRYSSGSRSGSTYSTGRTWDAVIESDPETKSLIVITDDDSNEQIKKIIHDLDRPVQQVLIKVVFVEVTHNNDRDVGVEGTYQRNKASATSDSIKTLFGVAAQSSGGIYHVIEKDLELTLRAMSKVGKLEVLSRPSILAKNNQQATITVGQRVPFINNSRITDTGQTINTVVYQDIGIILRVTPYITSDGLVQMDLTPEISALTGDTVPISDTINAPVYAVRSADTQVVVPDGETVVIGGLMQDNNTETVNKVPILGDIPLLGMAFRRTQTSKDKTELIIFLTPHVVEGKTQLQKLTNNESNKMELVPEVFTDKQMNKYLDNLGQNGSPEKEEPSTNPETPAPKKETKSMKRNAIDNSRGR